jgi:ankyrin repeat protein
LENDHIGVVKELLKHNTDIDSKDSQGKTPLHWGIFLNNIINLHTMEFFNYSFKSRSHRSGKRTNNSLCKYEFKR